jgi:periplasmic copper chaperone A
MQQTENGADKMRKILICLSLSLGGLTAAWSNVTVKEPWVRATLDGQKTTGAFMKLSSTKNMQLVSVKSSVAKMLEIHQMKMEGDVMKMRSVRSLAVKANETLALNPGGYHIMMKDLNQKIEAGQSVPLTLTLKDENKKLQIIKVIAIARSMSPMVHESHQH